MAWNEPGGNKEDPWSGRDKGKGPPDLDEVVRSLQEKLGGIFGSGGGTGGRKFIPSFKAIGLILIGVIVVWGLFGFYTITEGLFGVETRFGRYTETVPSGLHWHIPWPVETVTKVNVRRTRALEVGYRSGGRQQALGSVPREALMLTEDENIVDIRLAVQYRVKDAKAFLFNVRNTKMTLTQVTESGLRAVIGKNKMDYVLKEGRSEIVAEVRQQIQAIVDNYQAGIQITSVNLQDAQPPEEVQGAFEDAIKAREDKQRVINEAQAYRNDIVPKARGAGMRMKQEAEGYKQRVIAQAEGETNRFRKVLAEYHKAPDVTRKRLYLEAIEAVLSKTDTVMLDVKGSNNLLYLPLDKITGRGSAHQGAAAAKQSSSNPPQKPATRPDSLRTSDRGRTGRAR